MRKLLLQPSSSSAGDAGAQDAIGEAIHEAGVISGTLRHEGAVVAEDQEPLAWAFGQVEPPGDRPARHPDGRLSTR